MWDVRSITLEDADTFRERVSTGFGRDAKDDDASRERFDATFDYDRTLAAFDGDEMVGTISALSLELTVPGGQVVPMGGTTVITVRPTHRRQGVLRALMDHHLEDVIAHQEPLAGLWASESSIYTRFGYGIATWNHDASFDGVRLVFGADTSEDDGTIRLLETAEAPSSVPPIFEAHRSRRSGTISRSDDWWTHRVFADLEEWRSGSSALRYALYERGGTALGYAVYRQKPDWNDGLPGGKVEVVEVITNDGMAHTRLWEFLSRIDLFPLVEYWNLPVDDPLTAKVANPRHVERKLTDCLWVRLMDVPAALEARTYDTDGVLVLAVVDSSGSAETYRMEVSAGVGSCELSTGPTDITLDLDVLGHLYLGGGDAKAMGDAGRIAGHHGAVATLDRMFRGRRQPWCQEVF